MPSPITVQASSAKGRVTEGVRGMYMHNPSLNKVRRLSDSQVHILTSISADSRSGEEGFPPPRRAVLLSMRTTISL